MLKKEIKKTLEYSNKYIISPDYDGILSAGIVNKYYDIDIAGIYNTSKIIMFEDISPFDCVWLDHDIRHSSAVSIGNHLIFNNIKTNDLSFNPNIYYEQTVENSMKGKSGKGRDKFPFSTAYLVANALDYYPQTDLERVAMMHSDSVYKVVSDYETNARAWQDTLQDENMAFALSYPSNDQIQKVHISHKRNLAQAGYESPSLQKSAVNSMSPSSYLNNLRKMRSILNELVPIPTIGDMRYILRGEFYSMKGMGEDLYLSAIDSFSYVIPFKNTLYFTKMTNDIYYPEKFYPPAKIEIIE